MVSVVIDGASFGSADTTIVVEKVAVRLGVPESVTPTVTGILSPASFWLGVPERFPVPSMDSHAGPSVRLNVCVSPTSGSCTWIVAAYGTLTCALGSDVVKITGASLVFRTSIVYVASSKRPPLSVTRTATVMPVPTSSLAGVPERMPVFAPMESQPGPCVIVKVCVSSSYSSVPSITALYGVSSIASGMVSVIITGGVLSLGTII